MATFGFTTSLDALSFGYRRWFEFGEGVRGSSRVPPDGVAFTGEGKLIRKALSHEESDTLSAAEAKAIAEAEEWSKHDEPIPHQQVLTEFGLSIADWKKMST